MYLLRLLFNGRKTATLMDMKFSMSWDLTIVDNIMAIFMLKTLKLSEMLKSSLDNFNRGNIYKW